MARRRNIPVKRCQGANLPGAPDRIPLPAEAGSLEEWCSRLEIGDLCLLYEGTSRREGGKPTYYYWLAVEADTMPLRVCELDRFVDVAMRVDERWGQGRKPDYLVMGWYNGDCYAVFLELRQALTTEDQVADKFQQLEAGMRLLCNQAIEDLNQIHNDLPALLEDVCDNIETHRVVGVVVPATYSKSRARQKLKIQVGGKPIMLFSLPHYCDCALTWSGLLQAIGL